MTELRFFVFTCRDPSVDFRLPLVRALRRDFETWYIFLRRSPVVAGPHDHEAPIQMSIFRLLAFLWSQRNDGKMPVYFNSTNTLYPYLMALLRLISPRGVWCLDLHDDLLYRYTGLRRIRAWLAIQVMRLLSDVSLHAAPTLKELFPTSQHLGNASEMTPIQRSAVCDRKVLIMGSIDRRFDFGLLTRVAQLCPQMTFDIYGQSASSVRARLDELVSGHENVRYYGAYVMRDLPDILARYSVTFAPYVQGVRQTHYIDPLRFYDCLNSGMEVTTTDIPAAHVLEHALHVVRSEQEFAALFTESGSLKIGKQPHYTMVTWQQRAERLAHIVRRLSRARRSRCRCK